MATEEKAKERVALEAIYSGPLELVPNDNREVIYSDYLSPHVEIATDPVTGEPVGFLFLRFTAYYDRLLEQLRSLPEWRFDLVAINDIGEQGRHPCSLKNVSLTTILEYVYRFLQKTPEHSPTLAEPPPDYTA